MLLSRILNPEAIRIRLHAETKDHAIEELVDLLVETGQVAGTMRDHLLDVVRERERSMSTGMEHGVALPHGSTERFDRIVGALGLAPDGIPFETIDGLPARLVLLLVLPKNEFSTHIRTLAGIADLLHDAAFRQAIVGAESPETVLAVIRSHEDRELMARTRRSD